MSERSARDERASGLSEVIRDYFFTEARSAAFAVFS